MRNVFSETMKMSDLVLSNTKLLLMLPRFDIKLGFGDRSVREVCEESKVSPHFFLMICNVYCNNDFSPSNDDIMMVDSKVLINFLLESHNYYLCERLPHIEEHLNHIIDACTPKYGPTLKRFFNDYKNEVVEHFKYEEEKVFPYLQQIVSHDVISHFSMREFHRNHTNIEDKLSDLMNILVKYLPADVFPKERIEISLDIIDLSSDLSCHKMIEERVLIPFVESLENSINEC
ncbi:MAG: hemerythrin domain-containing protein [Candidatus Limimorpha sp.]